MPAREAFAYALLRVVPDFARGEGVNAAVVLFCRRADFLGIRVAVPEARLSALERTTDVAAIATHLHALELIAAGDPRGGAVALQPPSERFHWLVAPASTIVQPSAVHTGLCEDPAATLERLFERLVR